VVAAVAAYYLAGETLRAPDWIGGAFIVLACVASSRIKAETQRPQRAQRPQRKIQ